MHCLQNIKQTRLQDIPAVTGDFRDGVTAPHLGDGFIARVSLPVFCRGKEKKHNFHVATQRKRFQFNSEVTFGAHATCGPLAGDCSWLR